MKKLTISLTSVLILFSANIEALPNTSTPATFLGPILRMGFTSSFSDTKAYSVAAEAGSRNVRLGGTLGFEFLDNQRLKLSAEYLLENIDYPYFSRNTAQWVQQGAVGGNYQYELDKYTYLCNPQFDVSFYFSHSPSKPLRIDTGIFTNSLGQIVAFADNKRIAGSNAGGISPGFTLSPWQGGNVGANVNYDDVQYDTAYSAGQDAKGFGGTVHLNQAIGDGIEAGVLASIRKPFNNYQAHLTWLNVPFYGAWSMGVIGAYTTGKNQLPDTYNVGVSVDYLLDRSTCTSVCRREEALKFLNWTSRPAVYMPEVIAGPDQKVTTTIIGPI